jgi:hypothetical protein
VQNNFFNEGWVRSYQEGDIKSCIPQLKEADEWKEEGLMLVRKHENAILHLILNNFSAKLQKKVKVKVELSSMEPFYKTRFSTFGASLKSMLIQVPKIFTI